MYLHLFRSTVIETLTYSGDSDLQGMYTNTSLDLLLNSSSLRPIKRSLECDPLADVPVFAKRM